MKHGFKIYAGGLIAMIAALAIAAHAQAGMYNGYETPAYEVLSSQEEIELRRYEPHLVAEVRVSGARDQAIRKGFRVLAGFIFGDNTTGETVDMTVPVSQFAQGEEWTVRFVMPRAHSEMTLPRPNSPSIRFVATPMQDHLAVTFSGRASDRMLAEKGEALMAYARANGFKVTGEVRFHFYDDPFTLPWKRRNEVTVPVS